MKQSVLQILLVIGIILAVGFRPLPKQQNPQQQKVYVIRLSQVDMQTVLSALGKQPFNDVANTYLSITQQASQQDNVPETQQPKKDSTTKQNKKQ